MDVGKEDTPIFHEITTVEGAKKYLDEQLQQVRNARAQCDVQIPGDTVTSVRSQRKSFSHWMIRYGSALGSLTTLMHCRVIDQNVYAEYHKQILDTVVPTILPARVV